MAPKDNTLSNIPISDASLGHWQETFKRLREPGEPDTDQDAVREDLDDLEYSGPRLGPQLPIWSV